MKFACSSAAFARAVESGDLTQLEFLDAAAHRLGCDGVVLDARHFPRIDADYLAQVKKMTTDLGLCVAALAHDAFFGTGEGAMREALAIANAVGAPLLCAPLASETAISRSEQAMALGIAAGLAKSANVTLALRNAPDTFAASAHDCKRVTKETDSAWLRYGPDPAAFDVASDWETLLPKTVLIWKDARADASTAGIEAFGGFVALDRSDGAATMAEMNGAMRRWRIARADFELNRT